MKCQKCGAEVPVSQIDDINAYCQAATTKSTFPYPIIHRKDGYVYTFRPFVPSPMTLNYIGLVIAYKEKDTEWDNLPYCVIGGEPGTMTKGTPIAGGTMIDDQFLAANATDYQAFRSQMYLAAFKLEEFIKTPQVPVVPQGGQS